MQILTNPIIVVELKLEEIQNYSPQEAEEKLNVVRYFLISETREEIIEKYYRYIHVLRAQMKRIKQPEDLFSEV